MKHVPPDPPLTAEFLAAFVNKSRWMLKHGNWKERLLFRLAKAYLDRLTQAAIAADMNDKGSKWTDRVKR